MKNHITKSIKGHPFGNGFVLGNNVWQHDYRGSTVELMLGRQGWSETLNCSHPAFFIEIGKDYKGQYFFELSYSSGEEGRSRYGFHYNGQRIETMHHINSFELAKKKLIAAAHKKFGVTLVIHDEVYAYSFSASNQYGDENDTRLARIAYCEEKNCMVDLVTGSALIQFAETPKTFDISSVKARADDIRKFIKDSYTVLVDEDYCRINRIDMEACLKSAFAFYICEWDTKQGVERCKRQAVHLFNTSLMAQDTTNKVNAPYFRIPRDMSTPDWFEVA
ncbi:hypothetical protein VPHK404_0046 [Vibrio phage K404]